MSFRIANKLAKKSTFLKHRLGAVIVKGNRVVSTGFNEIRYSKCTKHSTVHAEEAAIIKLLRQDSRMLGGAELFVTRFTKAGNTGCSRPCNRCMALIKSVGISSISFINEEGNQERMKV